MHRSGTSCLTGCLEEAGLSLGDVNREAPHNRKGNNENLRVMGLHDDLLADSGGSWDAPPREVLWNSGHRKRRDAILEEYRGMPVFGIKDPRSLLTLGGWLEVLPDMRVVGTFRHPMAVARSLGERNEMGKEFALRLWCFYNRRLLDVRNELSGHLISFDLPPAAYQERARELSLRVGLAPPEGGFRFFEDRLRHQEVPAGGTMPPQVREIYDQLLEESR